MTQLKQEIEQLLKELKLTKSIASGMMKSNSEQL